MFAEIESLKGSFNVLNIVKSPNTMPLGGKQNGTVLRGHSIRGGGGGGGGVKNGGIVVGDTVFSRPVLNGFTVFKFCRVARRMRF